MDPKKKKNKEALAIIEARLKVPYSGEEWEARKALDILLHLEQSGLVIKRSNHKYYDKKAKVYKLQKIKLKKRKK